MSRRRILRVAFALAVLAGAVAIPGPGAADPAGGAPTPPGDRVGVPASATASGADSGVDPQIAGLLPNPVVHRDRGEYVLVEFPGRTHLSGWTLTDGHSTVGLGNHTVEGRVAFSPDPAVARNHTDHRVVGTGWIRLADAGDVVELRHEGRVVDRVEYEDAPEGEVWRSSEWEHRHATDRPVADLDATGVRAFVLPDAPAEAVRPIREADRRVLLAGYELTSWRVARELRNAADRGVEVRVLVEDVPVGGLSRRQARVLDELARAGIDVRAFGGEYAPYRYHHAKYAVVDDRAVVLTENWKPAGTGGRASRGWGVTVDSPAVADELAAVFRVDAATPTATDWEEYRKTADPVATDPANGSYPSRFDPRAVPVESVRVLVAPDNAEPALVELFRDAGESIRVEQVSVERGRMLDAVLAAARRGVRVRILLANAWYVREENRRIARELNRMAAREGLDLEVRLADPRSRFEKVHAKGAVVDGNRAVVGSLNWNAHSARQNREVTLVLEGEAVGNYYARVFRADWRGGAWTLPAGVVVLVVVALLAACAVGYRRIHFDPGPESGTPGPDRVQL